MQSSNRDVDLNLAARLRFAINRLNRQLRQHSGTGLTLSLQSALVTIDSRGSINLTELAAVEQVAPPTITKIVRKLEADGLVVRTPDPADGRATLVSTTPDGHARIAASRTRREAWLAIRLATLSPDEIDRLAGAVDVLERLARSEDRS